MDMKKVLSALGLVLLLAACDKAVPAQPGEKDPAPEGKTLPLRITPVMTKVTDTSFEAGDAIGVTVTREAGVYAANQKLSFAGSEFTGDLLWYQETTDVATIKAYYPYAAAEPAGFTVQLDQTAGLGASDFVSGTVAGVSPTEQAVVIPFKHRLAKVLVKIANKSGQAVQSLSFQGAVPTAVIAADYTAAVDGNAAAATIKAFRLSETEFALIAPPQELKDYTAAAVLENGKQVVSKVLPDQELIAGKTISYNFEVGADNIRLVTSGDIANWENGGEVTPDPQDPDPIEFEEHLDQGYFIYHDVKYAVVCLKEYGNDAGRWWMAQNLAYVPEGFTPSSDLKAVTAGVFYPLKVNDARTSAEFDTSAEGIAEKGYLYQAEVALGGQVGDLTSVAEATAMEGAQGICPDGWHVPTYDDMNNLIGKMNAVTNSKAPYHVNGNGSMTALNEDGFQMAAFGAVTVQDNTKTEGTFMGLNANFSTERISSGMFCGSTYGGVTYIEKDVESSGVKNLQFWGFIAMTNKSTEAEYTCNGTKVSYRIAAPLRCVRDNAE